MDNDFTPSTPMVSKIEMDVAAECIIKDEITQNEIGGAKLIKICEINLEETLFKVMPLP